MQEFELLPVEDEKYQSLASETWQIKRKNKLSVNFFNHHLLIRKTRPITTSVNIKT